MNHALPSRRDADDLGLVDAMRFLSCKATIPGDPGEAFLARWPRALHAPAVKDWMRADAPALDTKAAVPPGTSANWGSALLPPALLDPLVRRLQAVTVLARIPGLLRVPFNVPVSLLAGAASFRWVGQGSPKPVTVLPLESFTLKPTKCAAILPLALELVRLTEGGETAMAAALTEAATGFLDKQFLDPTVAAVPGVSPASITNGAPALTSTGDVVKDLAVLKAAFWAARPSALLPTFIMSPANASALAETQPNLRTDGGVCSGVPTVTTPGAGATLVMLDAAGVIYADGGAEIDLSRQAAIALDDAPNAATTLTDLWQNNLVGVRLERFANWAGQANAVQAITVAAP